MAVLLVTYDLYQPGQDYSDLYEIIKGYAWAKLSESSYAIETSESPQTIFDKLNPHIDGNDQLYVVTLKSPYWGRGSSEVDDWLRSRL